MKASRHLFFFLLLWSLPMRALAQETVQMFAAPLVSSQATADGGVALVSTPFDWLAQAKVLERRGDWDALLEWGQRWTREEPDNALSWYVLGRANNELQRYPEAIAAYRENLRLDPADVYAYTNLGNALRNSQRYPEAIRAYREALRLKPDCVRSWHNLGLTYFTLKGMPGVNQDMQALRQVDPALAEAWQKLALEYARSQDLGTAREALRVLTVLDSARRERLFSILFAGL
jgi:tetratricopeptide (TPR) repeat protein